MRIGIDKHSKELSWGDICSFTINSIKYKGMIDYEEDSFAYAFQMEDDKFPCILMSKVDFGSIEKIMNVYSTKIGDEYDFYRDLVMNIK